MQQKIQNKIFVCYIIAFEFVAANPHYYKEIFVIDKYLSVGSETVLKINISLTETISNSISSRVMKEHGKNIVQQIQTVFGMV